MQLLSDYSQWYDGIFDQTPPVFHRMAFTRGGLSKPDQFRLFQSLGLRTPAHGRVSDLARECIEPILGVAAPGAFLEHVYCVVYTDEHGHRGEGKLRLPLAVAATRHADSFASIYVPPAARTPVCFRLVRLGGWVFWLRQEGDPEGWQSNRRDKESVLSKTRAADPNPIARVLWAIDFIPSPDGLLAVDFNNAPELVTLGESGTLTPEEVRSELHHAVITRPDSLNQGLARTGSIP